MRITIFRGSCARFEVVLTERGRPVARLTRIETPAGPKAESSAELLQRLSEQGLVRRATKAGPLPCWKARKISGVPLSDTVRVEREDR
jgi:antitoxin (DNA-binding transcriptional repressor) of toxin-antitoxin stability system